MEQNNSDELILQMKGICKYFPGVVALNNVSLSVRKGDVHALMGENGAGKSTLMKILLGIYQKDKGVINFDGKIFNPKNTKEVLTSGISMIHQELLPVPELTVSENIFLGREITISRTGLIDKKKQKIIISKLFNELEIDINPEIRMKCLSVSQMQMVEIAKAISYNSKIIVMDEPTSSISEKEVIRLFKTIKCLQQKGISFIYISHKMDEIFEISNTITVLRDGEYMGTASSKNLNNEILIKMMVGRELTQIFPKRKIEEGKPLMTLENFTQKGKFKDINFTLKKGEILGFAGLMGAGRTELSEAIFGISKIDSGTIKLNGEIIKIKSPKDAINKGIALLSEDRKTKGLNLKGNVTTNTTIVDLGSFCNGIQFINLRKEKKEVGKQISELKIKTPSPLQIVNNLSGGNQQKVVLAKWLVAKTNILIFDEPTRGIDIAAKSQIYKIIFELTKKGKSVIVISSEIPELLGLCDRVLVMCNGRITAEFEKGQMNQENILNAAMDFEQTKKNHE